jgi:diacylglycerol O-acyltransferase / wax synthase
MYRRNDKNGGNVAERLSVLDASFLYLEKPSVHMHVAGLAILDPSTRSDGRLGFQDLAELIGQRIHLVPRFRQKVVVPAFGLGRPVWVDDPDLDVAFHLRRAALPSPGGQRELADFVQRVHSRPLDRTKPLWEMYLVEGLEGGFAAILFKSHHAMIDGLSGIDLATVLVDLAPEPRAVTPTPWRPQPAPGSVELLVGGLADQVSHPVRSLVDLGGRLLRTPVEVLDQAGRILGGIGSLISLGQAPPGPFNVAVGPNRRFAMAEVPVADAKAVKNALGGTVNDVVLAVVTGALRRLLRSRRARTRGVALRAMVPVSTRDPSRQMALGNQVSMFFVDLPVGMTDPTRRLRRIMRATEGLKSSHQAVGATALINTAQWAPPTLHALAARLLARQRVANLVVSNVPGPQVPIYLAGARLVATYPVMPVGPTLGLSIAVTSLSGTMGFGFTGDWDSVPDVDVLATGLLDSMEELKKAAGA